MAGSAGAGPSGRPLRLPENRAGEGSTPAIRLTLLREMSHSKPKGPAAGVFRTETHDDLVRTAGLTAADITKSLPCESPLPSPKACGWHFS